MEKYPLMASRKKKIGKFPNTSIRLTVRSSFSFRPQSLKKLTRLGSEAMGTSFGSTPLPSA